MSERGEDRGEERESFNEMFSSRFRKNCDETIYKTLKMYIKKKY